MCGCRVQPSVTSLLSSFGADEKGVLTKSHTEAFRAAYGCTFLIRCSLTCLSAFVEVYAVLLVAKSFSIKRINKKGDRDRQTDRQMDRGVGQRDMH